MMRRCVLCWAALLLPFNLAAETVYVIDKLLVGVHEEKSLDSAITKVLPTGSELELLERSGELARVKDSDGNTGWVDAGYLMQERPASLIVSDLEAKTRQLQEQLAEALARATAEAQADTGAADNPSLVSENAALKQQLSSEKLRGGELEAKMRDLEMRAREAQARIEALRQTAAPAAQSAPAEAAAAASNGVLEAWSARTWRIAAAAVLILLVVAYGAGIYTMDYLHRRRHGGFRV